MRITKISVGLDSHIGRLNDTKKRLLAQRFAERLPLFADQGGAPPYVFVNPSNGDAYGLEEDRVVFNREGLEKLDVPDFDTWLRDAEALFETLLLDKEITWGMTFRALIPATRNSMKTSKEINQVNWHESLGELNGVGLRLFVEDPGRVTEYKLEPFVHDHTLFYLEYTSGPNPKEKQEPESLENIFRYVRERFETFTGPFAEYCRGRLG